ncbi:MAG: hypothetical protein QOG83_144 [Alphaproteobacteria bacterium]|nr:hypothetical protein [Alphaproteobacteria bacterium]
MTAKVARVAGWFLVAAVVVLTLAPPGLRPGTGVEHHLEHLLAFALVGLMFGLGYPDRRLAVIVLGLTMIAVLEVLQLWVPGRHARVSDFLMNSVGVLLGVAVATLLRRMRTRRAS